MTLYTYPFRLLYRGTRVSNHTLTGVTVTNYGFTNSGGVPDDYVDRNRNPDWKVQVSRRIDASRPYSRSSTTLRSVQQARCQAETDPAAVPNLGYAYRVDTSSVDWANPYFGPESDADLREQARARLIQRLRGRLREAEALAPLAESRDLYRLVKTATGFCYETLMSLRDLARRDTGRARRQAQNLWLTWNFGIAPMARDIGNIGQAIAEHLAKAPDSAVRLEGRAKSTRLGTFTPNFGNASSVSPIGCEVGDKWGSYRAELSYAYVGSFLPNFSATNDYTLLDRVGIDLRSVPSALWELTAFSWIGDYFGNIGTYLSDVFYSPPGNLLYLSEIRKFESVVSLGYQYRVIPGNPNKMVMTSSQPMVAELQRRSITRNVLATLPTPSIRIRSADEIGIYSVSKLLNLLALMR